MIDLGYFLIDFARKAKGLEFRIGEGGIGLLDTLEAKGPPDENNVEYFNKP
ncbi:hypothetical protein M0G74_02110 [Microbulbifer sp. CAU 1566]|uniref:hypothetical protein n=1 Tax=Microbulbifer sp. CAU 1566 TaxID=2933269 RepID=UPI002002B748|nr:hypothetical protein [Microbulbifer sp. CAU 1566]MCK7596060.1 hypothetical protein [Microbulbifer sp. CAU 1566]